MVVTTLLIEILSGMIETLGSDPRLVIRQVFVAAVVLGIGGYPLRRS